MNKYNEVEIQTAKNLLKQGYKWIVRSAQGSVVAFSCKPRKREGYWLYPSNLACATEKYALISGKFTPLFQSIEWEDDEPTSLESIVHPQILDDAERRYLSAVIRPFRYKVRSVTKGLKINGKEEYIEIDVGGCPMFFPDFKANTMYKGMDLRKEYTLEELGL